MLQNKSAAKINVSMIDGTKIDAFTRFSHSVELHGGYTNIF